MIWPAVCALLSTSSALGPPPCTGSDVEIVPANCGTTPTGSPAGQAEGSYCAPACSSASDCPSVPGLTIACTMNQGRGTTYCEYKCGSDGDCPSDARAGKCEKNIVSSICTYPDAPSPPAPPSPPSPPTPTPPAPPPTPQNSHVRITKGLGSRGYNKVRVSLIEYSGDEIGKHLNSSASASSVAWSYQAKFQQRWTGNSIKTAVVDITPGKYQTLDLDGVTINVKIPSEDVGTIGMIFGDPCIHADPTWCKYGDLFKVKDTLHRIINGLSSHDALDYWMMNGDLFYDSTGSISKEFMTGLSLTAQARLSAVTLGNHDYWIGGHPSGASSDSFGNGHMQFYAQDAIASKSEESNMFDFSKSADSKEITDIKNAFWYNKIGNVAFIGFSNAYSWSESEPYFQEACSWVGTAKPALLLAIGHWNYKGDGCPSDMADADVYNRIKSFSGCSGVPFKYIVGHKHCNANYGDGALLGANGFEDGDSSCHGAFGIPIIDTRNNNLKLWYFELAAHEQKNGNFDAIVSCLESQGLDACLKYATAWWDMSLELGYNSSHFEEALVV